MEQQDRKESAVRAEAARHKPRLEHWRIISAMLILYDIIAVNAAYLFALLLRFDFQFSQIHPYILERFYRFSPFYTAFCILVFWFARLYRSVWRFASYTELVRTLVASSIMSAVHAVSITVIFHFSIRDVWIEVFGGAATANTFTIPNFGTDFY